MRLPLSLAVNFFLPEFQIRSQSQGTGKRTSWINQGKKQPNWKGKSMLGESQGPTGGNEWKVWRGL